jgi:hypothetical protein
MDDYIQIEIEIARRHNAIARGTKKSIGDFLLEDDIKRPVNVKSNNLEKNNYSPNIISAKRLINWLQQDGNELFFIFVSYRKTEKGIEYVNDSGLVPVHHLSWNCLSIEAQGWGVIQMCKPLEIDTTQDLKGFFKGMKVAYETYMRKESKKMEKILVMIKDF